MKLKPLGDKKETSRVYQYIRDGQYFQYRLRNIVMSQYAILFYSCDRNFNSPEFKAESKKLFQKENINRIKNSLTDKDGNVIAYPKGLAYSSDVYKKITSDFSTAIKNGLMKGERTLPTYKKTNPLTTDGRFLNFYKAEREYKGKTYVCYRIKWVNKIEFEVKIPTKQKRDCSFVDTLEKVCDGTYDIGGSSIYINNDNEIILNLCVKKRYTLDYKANKRTMGIALGYDKDVVITFSDSNKIVKVSGAENFVESRIAMQESYRILQSNLQYTRSGEGRRQKLKRLEVLKNRESNYAKLYNHKLSRKIVSVAVDNNVSCIFIEKIDKKMLSDYPTMLRNWSYDQLCNYIAYKASEYGIMTEEVDIVKDNLFSCYHCGESFEERLYMVSDEDNEGREKKRKAVSSLAWTENLMVECPHCKKMIDFGVSKAKALINAGK
jgi:IS605 OrfB family transposase